MEFPTLKCSERDREYRQCTEKIRDNIVFEYLFNGKSHRWLDEHIVMVDPEYSRGYIAMGVLHHMGLIEAHKAIFDGVEIAEAIQVLKIKKDSDAQAVLQSLLRFSQNVYSDESMDLFIVSENTPALIKHVGTSQYSDGVRINKEFHAIFNPPDSECYVKRGNARKIKVLFNNKIFDAEYRYEGQFDELIELQSIRFRKDLKQEFIKVFPEPIGQFEIRQGADLNHFVFNHTSIVFIDEDDEIEYAEGKSAYRVHRIRERNPEVIKKAKERFKKKHNGRIFCEVCGFDFSTIYGERGEGFIEGHHKRLVSSMRENEKTKIEDISMICPNCHRMIHKNPFIAVEELAEVIKANMK